MNALDQLRETLASLHWDLVRRADEERLVRVALENPYSLESVLDSTVRGLLDVECEGAVEMLRWLAEAPNADCPRLGTGFIEHFLNERETRCVDELLAVASRSPALRQALAYATPEDETVARRVADWGQ